MRLILAIVAVGALGSLATLNARPALQDKGAPAFNGPTCPDPSKLRNICMAVNVNTRDYDGQGIWSYAYERKIYEAACVDFSKDTPAIAQQKIQALWSGYQDRFKCSSNTFSVNNGSILKFALENRSWTLVEDAMAIWKLDLNIVDEADGCTLLDFAAFKIYENKGSELEPIVQNYYNRLRKKGALHARELPNHTNTCRLPQG